MEINLPSVNDIVNGWHLLRSTPISEEGSFLRDKGLTEWYGSYSPYVKLLDGIIFLGCVLLICGDLYLYLFGLLRVGSKDINNGLLLNFNRNTNYPCIRIGNERDSYQLIFIRQDKFNAYYERDLDAMSFLMMRAITITYNEIKDGKLPTFPTSFPFLIIDEKARSNFLSTWGILREIDLNDSIPRDRLFRFSYRDINGKHVIMINYLGNTSVTVATNDEIIDKIDVTVAGEHLDGILSKFIEWDNIIHSHLNYMSNNSIKSVENIRFFLISIRHSILPVIREVKLILHIPGNERCLKISLQADSLSLFRRLINEWDRKMILEFLNSRFRDINKYGFFLNQGYPHPGRIGRMFVLERDRKDPTAFRLKYRVEDDPIRDIIRARKEMIGIMARFEEKSRKGNEFNPYRYPREDQDKLSLILIGVEDDGRNHLTKVINTHYRHKIKTIFKFLGSYRDDNEIFDYRLFGGNGKYSLSESNEALHSNYPLRNNYEDNNRYQGSNSLANTDTSNAIPIPLEQQYNNEFVDAGSNT